VGRIAAPSSDSATVTAALLMSSIDEESSTAAVPVCVEDDMAINDISSNVQQSKNGHTIDVYVCVYVSVYVLQGYNMGRYWWLDQT
jgi:hypothetical protein